MIQNPVIPTRKSPPLIRIVGLTGIPCPNYGNQTRIPANPVQVATLRSSSSCSLNSAKELSRSAIGFRQLGYDLFRVSAVSNGGSDGSTGGYGGGSGDGSFGGDGGGGDADGGERKWSLLSWYLTLLEKYPVLTKAVTSAILAFVGDLTCQLAIEQVPSLDLKRIFLFSFLGLVLVGPTLHLWYLYLSKLVTMPGGSGALLRLVVDQFLFAPAFIGLFLSTLVTLEGRPSQVMPKLEQEWLSSVLTNWQLWIPFQFLNFRFVPQQFQVLAANFIALVWNVILSYKAHNEVITK